MLHAEAQRHRLANGRDAQELDAECCRIAQAHAERMAASGSMFHSGQDQCVAWGPGTPNGAIAIWRHSPPHNGWLLSGTNKAGWGGAASRSGTWYWCAVFRGSTASTTSTGTYSRSRTIRFWRRR
jgi:hypothetical protein